MSWKTQRQGFLDRDGDLQGKNLEDLISRRVLAGMGYQTKHVRALEFALLGQPYDDETTWKRTARVFQRCMAWAELPRWAIIVQETDIEHRAVRDRLEILRSVSEMPEHMPLVFARLKGTTQTLAFVYWSADELSGLTPPYKVVECLKIGTRDLRLIVQELTAFVRGLAAYDRLIQLENS